MTEYPTIEQLQIVRNFPLNKRADYINLAYYLKDLWHWEEMVVIKGKNVVKVELHTGGWSGNEDIISVLKETNFWMFWWQKSERGGHYYFTIPKLNG